MNNSDILLNISTNYINDHIVLGIDEAGRGPVLGPMVYACCFWNKNYESEIKNKFKFADSKVLKDEKRQEIYDTMKEYPNLLG